MSAPQRFGLVGRTGQRLSLIQFGRQQIARDLIALFAQFSSAQQTGLQFCNQSRRHAPSKGHSLEQLEPSLEIEQSLGVFDEHGISRQRAQRHADGMRFEFGKLDEKGADSVLELHFDESPSIREIWYPTSPILANAPCHGVRPPPNVPIATTNVIRFD